MKKAILYEIVNRVTELRYIGVTTMKLNKRWGVHLYRLRHKIATEKIQIAFNESGEAAFYIKKLDEGDLKSMLLLEKELTKVTVINGYNTIVGGGDLEERRSSANIFQDALRNNPEYKTRLYRGIAAKNIGKHRSQETKDLFSKMRTGKKWPEIQKKNRSLQYSGIGNPNSGNYKIYLNLQTGVYYSTIEMVKNLGIVKTTLNKWHKTKDTRLSAYLKT